MITRRTAEVGMATVTTLFGLATMTGASEYGIGWSASGPQPGAFPFYIGLMVTLASAGNALVALLHGPAQEPGRASFISREQFKLAAGFALPMIGFVVASLWLGLYVGTALYMFGTLVFQNGYSWPRASIIAVGLPVFFYLLIERTFKVGMLKGPLEAALGL
jgi:hypothetical protein